MGVLNFEGLFLWWCCCVLFYFREDVFVVAGKGRLPKPDHMRARANRDERPRYLVVSDPVSQPPLPDCMPGGEPWPERTVEWWKMWGEDPLSGSFRATDWSELMDTALIHAEVWSGNMRLANELRLRTARMGATAEDRARLRIQFAGSMSDDEVSKPERGLRARDRYPGLRAIDD